MSDKSNQDPHQGGSLSEMAKDGTKIPGDAGKMNLIPSKPSPQQAGNDLGTASLHAAADNPIGGGMYDDEAVTGTGHSIPSVVFTKPASKSGGK